MRLGGATERGSPRRGERAVRLASALAVRAADLVVDAAEGLADATIDLLRRVEAAWRSRPVARRRTIGARAGQPLPNLYEVYPEARQALARPLGLRSIAIDEIRGTAVAGIAQRGGDFLPLPGFRSSNWHARWQRVEAASERLAVLPPIDVIKYADGYWVSDGHNRVAAALYAGQLEIDADVTELHAPGTAGEPAGSLAASVAEGWSARAAGEGRWTRPSDPVVLGPDGVSPGPSGAPAGPDPEPAGEPRPDAQPPASQVPREAASEA